jgi:hypothetical protein
MALWAALRHDIRHDFQRSKRAGISCCVAKKAKALGLSCAVPMGLLIDFLVAPTPAEAPSFFNWPEPALPEKLSQLSWNKGG